MLQQNFKNNRTACQGKGSCEGRKVWYINAEVTPSRKSPSHKRHTRQFLQKWDAAILWQLRGLRGCYQVYIPLFFMKIALCGSYTTMRRCDCVICVTKTYSPWWFLQLFSSVCCPPWHLSGCAWPRRADWSEGHTTGCTHGWGPWELCPRPPPPHPRWALQTPCRRRRGECRTPWGRSPRQSPRIGENKEIKQTNYHWRIFAQPLTILINAS